MQKIATTNGEEEDYVLNHALVLTANMPLISLREGLCCWFYLACVARVNGVEVRQSTMEGMMMK